MSINELSEVLPLAIYIYIALSALLGICGFAVTAYDKSISRLPRGSIRRIPEKTFVLFSALGGGVGVLFSMLLFRHKTKSHNALLAKIFVFTVLHLAILLFFLSKLG